MRYSILVLLMACDGGITNQHGGGGKDSADTQTEDPNISVNVTEVDFGAVQYGKSYQQYVTITNTGAAELEVTNIDVDSPFSVNPLSVNIQPGGSTQVTVSVLSDAYADLSGTLVFESNDPDGELSVPLLAQTVVDADGDGYDRPEAGGDDCDDDNNRVNPGAAEIWYDGIDENCDGASDYDQDHDGYETDDYNEDPFDGGGDCQDSNTEYYPGAPDVPYDNKDTNCDDADDYDYDGDGSRSSDYGAGLDCDDNDPDVNISSDEQFNGKDDDCDEVVDVGVKLDETEYMYVGKGSYDQAGYSLAIGDLDSDGMAELVVGAPYYNAGSASANGRGMVGIFAGDTTLPATPGDLRDAAYDIQGDGSADGLGFFVTVMGDFDGSGDADLAVSALPINSYGGAVYLIDGHDVMSGRDLSDAVVSVTGTSSQYVGRGIATDIDLDGDGQQDLVAAYASGSNNAVFVEYGGSSGTMSVSSTDAQWSYTGTSESFYRNFPAGADLDGDGYQDLLFGDGGVDSPSTDSGAAWIVWGSGSRYSGSQNFSSVATTIGYGSSSENFGHSVQAGDDLDGDGVVDLWMYTQDTALYAFSGGSYLRSARVDTSDYLVRYTWDSSTEDVDLLRRGGDFSGDGIDDMFLGMPDDTYGEIAWISSELCCDGSSYAVEDVYGGWVTGLSDNENSELGFGLPPRGADIDGDGDDDYAGGDPAKLTSSSTKEGEVYVFLNEHLAE